MWSVIPGLRRDEERRRGRDRRSDDPIFLYKGPERRASGDRRGRSAAALFPGLLAGWLTFECTTERRRLVPIPARWEEVPESELYELCQRATPVSCTLQRGEGLLDVGS